MLFDSSGAPKLLSRCLSSEEHLERLADGDAILLDNVVALASEEHGERLFGIQCVHCLHSPAVVSQAENRFSKVFPKSLESLTATLTLIKNKHFMGSEQPCPFQPALLREEFMLASKSTPDSDVRRRRALDEACYSVIQCLRLRDRQPHHSGILIDSGLEKTSRGQMEDKLRDSMRESNTRVPMRDSNMRDSNVRDSITRESPDAAAAKPRSSLPFTPLNAARDPSTAASRRAASSYFEMYPSSQAGERDVPSASPRHPSSETPYGLRSAAPYYEGPPQYAYAPSPRDPYGAVPPGTWQAAGGPHHAHHHAPVPMYDYPPFEYDGQGWSCPYCIRSALHLRSPGYFSRDPPSRDYVASHYASCQEYYYRTAQSSYYAPPPHYGGATPPYGAGPPPPSRGGTEWQTPDRGFAPSGYPSNPYSPHEPPDMYGHPPHMGGPPPPYYGPPYAPATAGLPNPTPSKHIPPMHAAVVEPPPLIKRSGSEEPPPMLDDGIMPEPQLDCLVQPEDKPLLTEYFYYLNQQLKPCRFKEADRKSRGGKRKDIQVGFGGIACRHCWGKHGARKFFWADVDRLANSFSEIPAHVMKCVGCPVPIKAKLADYKSRHPRQMSNLPRGWQKIFFRRMWRRIHDLDPQGSPPSQDAATPANEALTETVPTPSPGSLLLSMPEDKQWLSDLDCQVRTWIEVFKVVYRDRDRDLLEKASGEQVHENQVGLRCVFCANYANADERNASVQFPPSIDRIYESVRELQRLHFHKCPHMPASMKQKVAFDKSASSLSSILRRYYVISAKAHGMQMFDGGEGGIFSSLSAIDAVEGSSSGVVQVESPGGRGGDGTGGGGVGIGGRIKLEDHDDEQEQENNDNEQNDNDNEQEEDQYHEQEEDQYHEQKHDDMNVLHKQDEGNVCHNEVISPKQEYHDEHESELQQQEQSQQHQQEQSQQHQTKQIHLKNSLKRSASEEGFDEAQSPMNKKV